MTTTPNPAPLSQRMLAAADTHEQFNRARPATPLPDGAVQADIWEPTADPAYRVIFGAERPITDYKLNVVASAVQYLDGSLDEFEVFAGEHSLNSDQARELAAALLEAAAELDGWAGR